MSTRGASPGTGQGRGGASDDPFEAAGDVGVLGLGALVDPADAGAGEDVVELVAQYRAPALLESP